MTFARIAPKQIRQQQDWNGGVPGSGQNGYAVVYNHSSGKFELGQFDAYNAASSAMTAHVGLADPHTQYALESALGTMATATETNYLLTDGSRTGATSQAQPFTNGLLIGTNSPASGLAPIHISRNSAGAIDSIVGLSSDVGMLVSRNDGGNSSAAIAIVGRTVGGLGANCALWLGTTASPQKGGIKYLFDSNNLQIILNGSVAYTFDSSNKFAIGVTPAVYTLHLGFAGQGNAKSIAMDSGAFGVWTQRIEWDVIATGGSDARGTLKFINVSDSAYVTPLTLYGDRLGVNTTTPGTACDVSDTNASTSAVQNALTMRSTNSATPGAGFGVGFRAGLKSSTTDDQDAGRLTYEWVTATHATRASRGKLSAYYTSTEQTAMTWDGDTGGLKLGFYGVTPVARQLLATGASATVDDVITALQNLGLVRQS